MGSLCAHRHVAGNGSPCAQNHGFSAGFHQLVAGKGVALRPSACCRNRQLILAGKRCLGTQGSTAEAGKAQWPRKKRVK
jgi:hypothetical protein